ncbi:MAG: EamA family transporter [Chitinophagaceae bacterium]|nr:EamA family transporter [Chitinophagaceae bacterium]
MSTALPGKKPSQALIIAAFAAIYIIWGSTYIAIMIAIKDIPPLIMAGVRFMTAGLILYTISRIRGQQTPSLNTVSKISLSGVLMLFFGTGSLAWVEQYITTGLAAIIVATVPLWFVLFDKRNWKSNFSSKWIMTGLLVGFIGVLLLFADKKSIDFSGDKMIVLSFFVLVIGTIFWSIGSLYSKYTPMAASTGMKASFQMMAAGLASVLLGLAMGEHNRFDINAISSNSVLALIYLVTFGSLIGYMAYVWLLSVRSPAIVGTYAYVNPVVAVFLGSLILHEPINPKQLLALGVILLGVILVSFANAKK